MPPKNHMPPDPYEQEYAIRALTTAVEKLTDQCEQNAKEIVKLRDAAIEWKLKWGLLTALAGVIIGIAMKFLPLHS